MTENILNRSIEFFELQLRRQTAAGEYAPNPFELAVLPFLSGEVLDGGLLLWHSLGAESV